MEQSGDALESNSFIPNSQISNLLSKLTAMAKKPTIESDISQVLDEFLVKLNEYDKYLEHGIFNMNFAEAALLLQNSADIYSKKVDLLWDIIFDYQKRILMTEQNADKDQEVQKLEERKRKYKRKRITKETEQVSSQLINNFSFGATEYVDHLNATFEPHNLLSEWEKLNVSPPANVDINDVTPNSGKDSLFLPTTKVYTEDREYVGRYDQFHSMYIMEEIFQTENQQEQKPSCITKVIRTESYVTNDGLLEKSVSTNVPVELTVSELSRYNIAQFKDTPMNSPQQNSCTIEETCFRESYVCLERLPVDLVREKLRRISVADSLFDDDGFSSISERCISSMNETDLREDCENGEFELSRSLEKRNKSCSQDSAFYELEDEEMNVDGFNTPAPETPICCGGSVIIPRTTKRNSVIASLAAEDIAEEKAKKRKIAKKPRRISEKQLKKLSTGITVGLKEFEKFCRVQYKPGENEGEIPPESDSSSEDEDPVESSDEEETPESAPEEPVSESDHDDDFQEPEQHPENNELTPSIPLPPTELPSQPSDRPTFTSTQSEESRKTVREWRNFIIPKLKSLENKSDFDIHEYGSTIMEGSEVGEERGFGSIVQGKGAAEVARFFLATLQLATTGNIEIMGAVPGTVAKESFKVKTLDKTRYHELLDVYQAPSEETFRDRLERAQAMNPKVRLHSTPSTPAKKIKLASSSKKKLF